MTPLQLSGFGVTVGVLYFAGVVVSIVVGLFVGYRALGAYRQTGQRALLLFSVGLLLLVSVSKLANVLLSSTAAATAAASPTTELLRLCGAIVIMYAIYDR